MYWYEDALADPLTWHHDFLASVGLHLPIEVVKATAKAAVQQDFSFKTKPIDPHPGGESSGNRSYVHEVSAETLSKFDVIMRTWLPPVLLVRFGVPRT